MSYTVYVEVPAQDAQSRSKILLMAPFAHYPWDLFPLNEERWGFFRVISSHGYPWKITTTLHYLRQNVDKFYANPSNRLMVTENSGPSPEFYTLPPDTIVIIDMWDNS